MSSWRRVIECINKCKGLPTEQERLNCLLQLYDETKDGMVALEIGNQYQGKGRLEQAEGQLERSIKFYEQAIKFYKEAEEKFPLEKWKNFERKKECC